MKTKTFALAAILLLLAVVGVAAAQSLDAEINAPVVRCLNSDTACNDYKLVVNQPVAGYLTLNGYEYGCGATDHEATGTGYIVGNTLYIGLSVNAPDDTGQGPRFGNRAYAINRTTGVATYDYSYHYDSYHWGSGTGTWGACAKEGPTGGPDESR